VPAPNAKFIQIAAVRENDAFDAVYALDDAGHVWRFADTKQAWVPLPMRREATP
jgi:hypothetical protein